MFILRNPKPVRADEPWGSHTGDKEIITIEQVIAAEGGRRGTTPAPWARRSGAWGST